MHTLTGFRWRGDPSEEGYENSISVEQSVQNHKPVVGSQSG